ncbi:LysE family transporter [Kitasatospora cathayae]|uniref:LysE family transporter n=1 Tax=Kitasatospora cathayae TaxID=3004092 RepID=A0ABY7QCZ6_9ACTN|nr:LysE family transporter [Kitasatospora sp. HUAS 3-15]WBP90560.1 LysE family transporter [Kitasatospora sp. HUAS 3-15]
MRAALVAGLLAGYGVAVPVGAVGAYLVSLTARTSLRTGACAALGVAAADGLYALLAALGGAGLAPLLEPLARPLRIGSALVLLALAARTAVTALRARRLTVAPVARTPPGPFRAFLTLLGITLLNPLTVLYFAALILGGGQGGSTSGPLGRAVFTGAVFAASASWQLLLASGGALLGRTLTGARGRLLTALGSAALVGWLALRLLLD